MANHILLGKPCVDCGVEITSANGYPCIGRKGQVYYRGRCKKCQYLYLKHFDLRWEKKNPEVVQARNIANYWKDPSRMRQRVRDYRQRIKIEVFSHYSGSPPRCADPFGMHDEPFTDVRCLTLDHVDGSGARHREELQNLNKGLYTWILEHNFPEGFQVLCYNCQFVKKIEMKEDYHILQ